MSLNLSNQRNKNIKITTVIWGVYHREIFLNINLKSLLTPNNLYYFKNHHLVTFEIYTFINEIQYFENNSSIIELKKIIPIIYHVIPDDFIEKSKLDPIFVQKAMWNNSINLTKLDDSIIFLLPPDTAWSEGSFKYISNLLYAGKTVIMNFYVRVVADTFIPQFLNILSSKQNLENNYEFISLSLAHIHPMMAGYFSSWPQLPEHLEFIIWPVKDEGLLIRNLAMEPLVFYPNKFQLNERGLIIPRPSNSEFELISNSNDVYSVSITPLGKKLVKWFGEERKLNRQTVGRWILNYYSPAFDLIVNSKVRIHLGKITNLKWKKIELTSDLFINRSVILEIAYKIESVLKFHGFHSAANLVNTAISDKTIFKLGIKNFKIIIIIPPKKYLDKIIFKKNHVSGILKSLILEDDNFQHASGHFQKTYHNLELLTLSGVRVTIKENDNIKNSLIKMIEYQGSEFAGFILCDTEFLTMYHLVDQDKSIIKETDKIFINQLVCDVSTSILYRDEASIHLIDTSKEAFSAFYCDIKLDSKYYKFTMQIKMGSTKRTQICFNLNGLENKVYFVYIDWHNANKVCDYLGIFDFYSIFDDWFQLDFYFNYSCLQLNTGRIIIYPSHGAIEDQGDIFVQNMYLIELAP